MQITKAHKTAWGSYGDRKNSFDDDEDIKRFIGMIHRNESLKSYLKTFLPKGTFSFKPKPHGQYGVDLGLFSEHGTPVATIDIERWSAWNEDWPSYYKHIHFLGRKEKFLNQHDAPFFMAFMNFSRTKVLMISQDDIIKHPTIDKFFKHKGVTDRVRELKMSEGYLFGEHITDREEGLFNVG